MQAHYDVVVYEDVEHHFDVDEAHEDIHHQNDSHEEKSKEHHHHCTVITFSSDFIATVYNFQLIPLIEVREEINFYQNKYSNSFLNEIFQPPKF
ncbi:conserved protein of unknown function [Tenacibaculum sp. 190524A02b]